MTKDDEKAFYFIMTLDQHTWVRQKAHEQHMSIAKVLRESIDLRMTLEKHFKASTPDDVLTKIIV